MIQEQFLMMLRRGDRFCPGSKAFLRRAAIIATYDAKLTRDLSSSVKGRDAFCSTIVIAHFSKTKTTFQPDFNRGFASRLAKDAISTDRSTFAVLRGLFALSRGKKRVCNAVSDALVDNRLRKDAVSTRIEFPDYSGYPSSDNLACVMSVERSIRVCAHKGQAKITPGRDDTRAIFNDVTSRRSFFPGSKAFLRRPTIIATYDAKLTRDLSSSVKGRAAFCSTIVIAHFSTTKTTFQPRVCVAVSERCDFNRSVGFRDYSRFVRALSRGKKPVCNAVWTRWLIISCEKTRSRPGSSSRIIPSTRQAII
jgi:hypothetical protein